MPVKTTSKKQRPTIRAQLVQEESGDVLIFTNRRGGDWSARIKADGTMTPGQIRRLHAMFK